jgi:hypothetical protein
LFREDWEVSTIENSATTAVEMTLLWKSQNDSHRSVEISLESARFPHFHKPYLFLLDKKNVE